MFEFKDFDFLTDGEIDLKIEKKTPSNDSKACRIIKQVAISHRMDKVII